MAWFVSRRNCPCFLTANTVAGPLDGAHRSGRATGDHQDPAATLLLPGRTAHPLSAPTHPAPATTLALGKPVQSRPGETARPPTPFLTAPDPSARLSTGLAVPRQAGTSVSTAAICPADLPLRNHLRSSTTSVRGAHSPHPAESLRIKALQPLSRTSHPCLGRRDCIASVDSGLAMTSPIAPNPSSAPQPSALPQWESVTHAYPVNQTNYPTVIDRSAQLQLSLRTQRRGNLVAVAMMDHRRVLNLNEIATSLRSSQ